MLESLKISQKLRKTIESELQPDEQIRWVEQPIPRIFSFSLLGVLLLGMAWTGMSLFWMWNALGYELLDFRGGIQEKHLLALCVLPFNMVGPLILSTPLWVRHKALNTVYLVTNKRAITFQRSGWSTTIRSFSPNQLKNIYRKERDDGTGDVILTIRQWKDGGGDPRSEEIGFLDIRNPKEMEARLKQFVQNYGS